MATQTLETGADPFLLLGDHLALDLLNTTARDGGAAVEYWTTEADFLRWLTGVGVDVSSGDVGDDGKLLARARALRATARELVERRARGEAGDVGRLNAYLHAHTSAPHLEEGADGAYRLVRVASAPAADRILGTLAESVAQLLAEGDFKLVKQCEHPECVLWFYDRTKAHRRRWCSMNLCGNRMKAAQFRLRAGGVGKPAG